MSEITEKALKRSQIMYIIQAALEYFISIMVTGSFLATITKELGFSDSHYPSTCRTYRLFNNTSYQPSNYFYAK